MWDVGHITHVADSCVAVRLDSKVPTGSRSQEAGKGLISKVGNLHYILRAVKG